MSQYSVEEKKAFREKDIRISKLALLKSIIEKSHWEVINEVNEICNLVDKYMQYVNGVSGSNIATTPDGIDWVKASKDLSLTESPNRAEIKILDLIASEYKISKGVSVKPADVLKLIFDRFGRYPTKQQSVSKVVSILTE